ncbi:MAG: hypothetical protein RLZZ232_1172 [Planctomycetota bacterium]|jgi:hypothetical protein
MLVRRCRVNRNWARCFFLIALGVGHLVPAKPAVADVITWQSAQAITGDLDVDTTGTLVYAYNFGPDSGAGQVQSATVGGVNFAAFAAPLIQSSVQTITVGNATLSETPGELNGIETSANSGAFASLSAPYKNLLGTAIVASYYATMTLSLGGLDAGKTYRIQTWVNDSNYDINQYNRVQADGGGNTTELKANLADAVGGLGQYVIGTFTATGNTQDISFVGLTDINGLTQATKNPIINAFQLRLESSSQVPEPASMVFCGLGTLCIVYFARRRVMV